MSRLVESNCVWFHMGPAPNSMQTSQTKKNPSNPATALKTQINEVSISSGMFFCSIMGETFVFNHSRLETVGTALHKLGHDPKYRTVARV